MSCGETVQSFKHIWKYSWENLKLRGFKTQVIIKKVKVEFKITRLSLNVAEIKVLGKGDVVRLKKKRSTDLNVLKFEHISMNKCVFNFLISSRNKQLVVVSSLVKRQQTRSSQWRSDHSTTAHLSSICIHSFGVLAKAVRLFMGSLHSQPMCSQTYAVDIFVNLQPFGRNLKRRFSVPLHGRLGSGIGPFDSPPMGSY